LIESANMKSSWSDSESRGVVDSLSASGVPEDVALRVYTSRLLGRDPKLVLHGGGNTSVKTVATDVLGEQHEVLRVKGSGWDMAYMEPEGLPAVKLKPLLSLRSLDRLDDEALVNFERLNLMDSSAPTPSIETLLHALLPHKFVDHTHSTAVLSLTNQPSGIDFCREVLQDRAGIVPYIMPGFDLAKKAASVYEEAPWVEALILLKHGIFTFGDSARQAYERMIEMVTLVEARLKRGRRPVFAAASLPQDVSPEAQVAPVIRGACILRDETGFDGSVRFILDFRTSPGILDYVNGRELHRYSQVGVATPDHTIRTKCWPLILPPPLPANLAEFSKSVREAFEEFGKRYHDYFQRHNSRQPQPKTELDPFPRVLLVSGLGLFGAGRNARDASIAADIAESTIETITDAEAIGTFESASEADLFDLEYWSLEQAKLGKSPNQPFTGCVVLVTGGGGAIGAATAEAFAREGAEVAVLDIDEDMARETCRRIGGAALAVRCDVTDADSVRAAFDTVCRRFGGVDVVVSNAGAAWQGSIADVPADLLRKSFDLNFFAHQTVSQNAVRVMRAQGSGGTLLFNVTKQAVNPSPDFGPYGLPKAATLFLVRQYAIDHGREGIRSNAVNADRVRGGLLTPDMIAARAKARGVSEEEYMRGNLLGKEVTPRDVAEAFLHQALEVKTTGDVTTVDGGNIAAMLR
jgi:rhamnose utilization protein RhaD (predicted bifunctional aldolase and dehydrogenase)/NAD(P)-dependent dehydrogenase (short-subunit alcohol dehydrogenase family)